MGPTAGVKEERTAENGTMGTTDNAGEKKGRGPMWLAVQVRDHVA